MTEKTHSEHNKSAFGPIAIKKPATASIARIERSEIRGRPCHENPGFRFRSSRATNDERVGEAAKRS
jgi:hypothetical protein